MINDYVSTLTLLAMYEMAELGQGSINRLVNRCYSRLRDRGRTPRVAVLAIIQRAESKLKNLW